MPLDPSIYQNVGRVNFGQGLSDILDQQRQREMQREQQATTLASLAQQQELGALNIGKLKREEAMVPQQMAQKRNQELNMWLSGAVQSGRPQEEVRAEAIAKGQEIGVAPEVTQKHVAQVFASAQQPQARSDFAFTQAYPELVAKQRAESMYAKPQKPSDMQLEPVIGPNGQPILVTREIAGRSSIPIQNSYMRATRESNIYNASHI